MHIFISYAKQDAQELAVKIQNTLSQLPDVTAWMDISLEPATSWASQIEKEIDRCDCVVVLLSPDVNRPEQNRSFVLHEIDYAQVQHKRIIPVKIPGAKIPLQLAGIQYIDMTMSQEAGIKELIKAVSQPVVAEVPQVRPAFLEYEERYRSQFALRHSTIIPPYFSRSTTQISNQ